MLFRFLKPYKKEVIILSFLAVIYTCIALAVPWVYKQVFDDLLPHYSPELLITLCVMIGLICFFSIIINAISYTLIVRVRSHFTMDMRTALMKDFLEYPYFFYVKHPGSLLVGLFGTDMENLGEFVWNGLRFFLSGIQLVLMLGFILVVVGLRLFLLFVCAILLYFIWTMIFRNCSLRYSRRIHSVRDQLYGHFTAVYRNIKEIKCFHLYDKAGETLKSLHSQKMNLSRISVLFESLLEIGGSLCVRVSLIIIFIFGYYGILINNYTPGFVMTNIVYAVTIIYPIVTFFTSFSSCYFSWHIFAKIRPFVGLKGEIQEGSEIQGSEIQAWEKQEPGIEEPGRGITISCLYFSYPADTHREEDSNYPGSPSPVLRDLSMKIPASSICTIVGTSGAGKTTLVSLLVKLYQPPRDSIYIAGQDICDISITSLRKLIGIVTQDPHIFHDTIRNNIDPDNRLTDSDIHDICSLVSLQPLFRQLPLGLETMMTERGQNLSGGEKQRLALARGLARGNRVMILDEVTSALDMATEGEIINTIQCLRDQKGITFINISHRLAFARHSDHVFVLEQGTIKEQGCHDTLMNMGGRYYEIITSVKDNALLLHGGINEKTGVRM
jgi:ABC-type multidrug transport system fused ATPase/permease subunit